MREMKYIVTTSESGEQIFIFDKNIMHSDFFDSVVCQRIYSGNTWRRVYRTPISAGFTDGKKCYGRSESMNIDSRPIEDTKLLTC